MWRCVRREVIISIFSTLNSMFTSICVQGHIFRNDTTRLRLQNKSVTRLLSFISRQDGGRQENFSPAIIGSKKCPIKCGVLFTSEGRTERDTDGSGQRHLRKDERMNTSSFLHRLAGLSLRDGGRSRTAAPLCQGEPAEEVLVRTPPPGV